MLRRYQNWLEAPKAIITDAEELEAKPVADQSVSHPQEQAWQVNENQQRRAWS